MAGVPPEDFRCPISLELMSDPVILATGQTYDRCSIQRWLDAGHRTCPKTKQVLHDTRLIPNYALKSLVEQWGAANGVELLRPLLPTSSDGGGPRLRTRVEGLVKCLSGAARHHQRDAAREIKSLARDSKDGRSCIVDAGAVARLLPLLSCGHPPTEEAAVAALFELSMDDENKVGLVAEGAVDAVVKALRGGSMDTRAAAARTLTSIAMVDVNKVTIGSHPGAISALVRLLCDGTARAKKDALCAICVLCMFPENKTRAAAAGAVLPLLTLLTTDPESLERAITALDLIASATEGKVAIAREPAAMPTLVSLLNQGSQRSREHAAAVLCSLCTTNKKNALQACNADAPTHCANLLQTGTARAKRKAATLMKAFQDCTR